MTKERTIKTPPYDPVHTTKIAEWRSDEVREAFEKDYPNQKLHKDGSFVEREIYEAYDQGYKAGQASRDELLRECHAFIQSADDTQYWEDRIMLISKLKEALNDNTN